jgi:hypothetical protein
MTTTIDLFKFTAPTTKKVRPLTDARVYEALAEQIWHSMEHDADDEENTTYIEVKVDDYTAQISIRFDAEWHKDSDWYDGGEYVATRLCDITPIDIYKTYTTGDDEFYINLELDTDRLWKMITNN